MVSRVASTSSKLSFSLITNGIICREEDGVKQMVNDL